MLRNAPLVGAEESRGLRDLLAAQTLLLCGHRGTESARAPI